MKLILKQSVENLGDAGAVVQVKAGYGRNYLIPQGLAYVASDANMKRIEEESSLAEERTRRDFLEARRRASQLEGMSLTFTERAGEDGKLFGSVTAAVTSRCRSRSPSRPRKAESTVTLSTTDPADFPAEVTRAAELAVELKAHDVVVLDLRGISSATDYFVIAGGRSDVQVKAIADHVVNELKKDMKGGRWVLVDYVDFVLHVFHPEARQFYQLENLWGDAARWESPDE